MLELARTRITLTPTELSRLRAAAERDAHAFVDRLQGPIDVEQVEQPWFRTHRILEIGSGAPFPARGLDVAITADGEVLILTARIEHLQRVAAADPPAGMDRLENAAPYALYGNGWTSTSAMGEVRIDGFDDIPWQASLDDAQRARIEELRQRWSAEIQPETSEQTAAGWRFRHWCVATRQLIERELVVAPDGQLRRTERVHEQYLPVPPGRYWRLVKGRLVPVG
jgi:hypothetical protein